MARNQISITVSKREQSKLERLARDAGLSLSNYVRRCLGLAPLIHGGARKKTAEQLEEK